MDIISKNKKRVLESVTKGFKPSGVRVEVNLSEEMSKSKVRGVLTRPEIKKAVIQLAEDYLSEVSKNFRDSKSIEQINAKLILDAKREFSDNSRNLRIGLAELDSTLQSQLRELSNELQNAKSDTESVKRKAKTDYEIIERSIKNVLGKIEALNIPKQVTLKAGRNVFIQKEETNDSIEYTVNADGGGGVPSGSFIGNVIRQIYAGNNVTVSQADSGGGVTVSSTGGGGSSSTTYVAGEGININGPTVTNTIRGVSALNDVLLTSPGNSDMFVYDSNQSKWVNVDSNNFISSQANVAFAYNHANISGENPHQTSINQLVGVTIGGEQEGDFLRYMFGRWSNSTVDTNHIPEGSSNFYFRGDRIVGIGGASVSINGLTLTVYAQSSGSPAWGDLTGTLSNQTDLWAELVTKLSGTSTTNLLNEGTSNFYWRASRLTGSAGISVSTTGLTTTLTISAGEVNTASNQGTSGVGVFDTKASLDLQFRNITGESQYFGVSLNGKNINILFKPTAIDHGGLQGLGDDDHTQYHTDGRALTWLGTRTTNDLPQGTSNFYYNPLSFVGTGGVSASVTGRTVTLFGLSTALNTNNAIEGGSGLFYSSQRFSIDFALKTTNDLSEGASNFYYRTSRFVGAGGVSVSANGLTITIYGSSSAHVTDNIAEGISNFYWRTDRVAGSTNITVSKSGVSLQIDLTKSGISANFINGVGTWESPIQSKSIYLEGCTSTDFIPFYRVEQSMSLIKTVYDISGGTNWVGQVQRWNNAQGASKYNTQTADTGVTTTQTVTSYTGSSYLQGEYIAIKGASIAGGVSWLLVNVYWRNN